MVRLKKGEYYLEIGQKSKNHCIVQYIGNNQIYLIHAITQLKKFPFPLLTYGTYKHIPKDMLLIEMEILARKKHENRTK
jgi:hypothetical protein